MPGNRNIIQFPANTPVPVVLETDPTRAKQGSRTTKSGKQQYYWTYFAGQNSIFFADRDLNQALQGKQKGDSVIITNVVSPGNKWGTFKVEGGSVVERAVMGSQDIQAEILENTRKILATLNAQKTAQINQNPLPKEVGPDLGF